MTHSAASAERVQEVTLQFLPDSDPLLTGDLQAGGRMTVEYAADRVPCRRERVGVQIGHLIPFIGFQPSAQVYRGTGTRFSVPIPTDATQAEVWFLQLEPDGV
jgi:hypothetical protein